MAAAQYVRAAEVHAATGPDLRLELRTAHRRLAVFGAGTTHTALGSAQRSTVLMDISASLVTQLALLTEALDDDGSAGVAASLQALALDAAAAVSSYLGVTVTQCDATPAFTVTAMEEGAAGRAVRTSLLMPLPGPRASAPALVAILYAATPGAFVDLAADLSWLTRRPVTDFVLDQHLRPPPEPDDDRSLPVLSLINQAIGVLIGRGYRFEDALRELDDRAGRAGQSRYGAAREIVRSLSDRSGRTREVR